MAGTYNVSVSTSSGNCSGKTANCGTLIVNPPPSKGNDITNYKTVVIGTQTWMAENLDYNVSGSKCFFLNNANCETYGRLYDWFTAMDLPSGCQYNSLCAIGTPHRGICPSGWHIPSNADWDVLIKYVDPSCTDNVCASATKLKANSPLWDEYYDKRGTDDFGFSALPSGYGYGGNRFIYGDVRYWSATRSVSYASYMTMSGSNAYITNYYDSEFYSVRCLKD